jgi:6-phosphofructokinase
MAMSDDVTSPFDVPVRPGQVIGVLTGGGDAPGLNAAICGIGRRLLGAGASLVGFKDGWRGVIENDVAESIDPGALHGLLAVGGTVLGSSSANPYRNPARDVPRVRATIAERGLDALIAIGGDGTLGAAERLVREEGLPIVAAPKTIDNDVAGTDFTFGFWTAVERVTACIDDLRTTAQSHHRVLVVECMGRHVGWITAYAGVAAGAEAILVPERRVDLTDLGERLKRLRSGGVDSAILAIAEGARVWRDGRCLSSQERDAWGEYRTGGSAGIVAAYVQEQLGWEARPLVLGHLQRSGPPCAFDRIFGLRLGARAARLALEGRFGRMAAMQNGEVVDIPIAEAVVRKVLPDRFLDRYESFFIPDD